MRPGEGEGGPATFIQGMRRSGTTILYDCLSCDPRFAPFYEPFTLDKPAMGGGSGATAVDLFTSTRNARRAFLRSRGTPSLTPLLNHGSPRRPDLELESDLPPFLRDYLGFLLAQEPRPLVKFTRMAAKVQVLTDLDPKALFIHLVRDPRSVATSHMFGRGPVRRDNGVNRTWFFSQRTRRGRWGAFDLSRCLMEDGAADGLRWPPDFMRVLLVWNALFEATHAAGSSAFGSRYVLLRHETFAESPEKVLDSLYARMGLDLPEAVVSWARAQVRPPRAAFADGHPAWARGIARLGLGQAMEEAGYQ